MNKNALTPTLDASIERTRRTLVLAIAVFALTVPAAYLSGVVLLRWGDPVDLAQHLAVLNQMPDQLGQWRYVADGKPVSDAVVRQLELRGHTHRVYEHPATGQRVAVLLLIGPAGPLVRHPPEICYETGANDLLTSQPITIESDGRTDDLRLLSYRSDSLVDGDFLVAYAFGADRRWGSPASPRLVYGGKPSLYKLQVLTESFNDHSQRYRKGLEDFLALLLPSLNSAMATDS